MSKERPSSFTAYFSLFHGEAHPMSEMIDCKPAIDILIFEGKAIEQFALDGDSLISMPEAVKKNGNQEQHTKKR